MANAEIDEARRAVLAAQVAAPGETSLADVAERVAIAVAEAEPAAARTEWAERFSALIAGGSFLPSVPTLANAGRGGQLAACFVLDVVDSLDSIYGTLQRAAAIQQGSGGVGVEFSALRPRGTPIERSGGHTPGPVAFTELFARSAQLMGMAGRRAGAHLAVLRDDHPDIVEFVRAKRRAPDCFPQLGLAVGVSDGLLRAARENESWELRHAHGAGGRIAARDLLREIAGSILETGDPTLLFLDRIEADNPTPALGALRATNPCGEQPLLSGESCVLGSLQLPAFLKQDGELDEQRLGRVVRDAVRFLDDALEVNAWPDGEIALASRRTRKVGLGIMGLADLLLHRGMAYDRLEAREFAGRILGLVAREADAATCDLGEERGVFPAWERGPRRRNATTRALAPTGTLRLLVGCSPGIEPFFAPRVALLTEGRELTWSDVWLVEWLARRTLDPQPVLDALAAGIGHRQLPDLSDADRVLLRRAWEISPEDQLAMQACTQRWVDGAVSKTVHLDGEASPTATQVVDWIQRARSLGCKGVAFYRRRGESAPARIDLRAACRHSCRS
ncbi:MAG: ribonucleoside-diphosphate reductase, adenosylcobalamin-dependent [Deltaproteobacteria bacterium]|nr:ribonucleoside-diphosphate reductase, adenosylcobalamin-dependent [Deltaproteobacteria bacterium]MBW2360596.1 ribonucleoside-diphosphate reductase, adenosylcobalamin-dependent [Deltaproteobacteria bacterium]